MKQLLALVLLLSASLTCPQHGLLAANVKTTVQQVTDAVTLADDVDYIVTSATPFGTNGVVDIVNAEHAVLILSSVKPSKATSLLASHVRINGQKAVDGSNCQLKVHNRGSIIMPYGNNFKPLTVYSERAFAGESCSDFGLEDTGGFMNTLTDKKLNNRIRSFKLKRGYMVTFSLLSGGRGYSRCFIAADADKEVSTLPTIMDQKISSYRVFKWYDAGKTALAAAAGDDKACAALNVTSTYTWGTGQNMSPDVECVAHQIYSGYPSASACGSVTWTPHLKTSNEPRNPADDHPEDLNAILNNWESLMRTGMRLCTPSSWDGSDYWNGTGFLKEFLDSIDARGWRCDILDMHCYWAEGSFPNLRNWKDVVSRPIWISEWCWGASWNTNGAFASGVNETQVKEALQRICNTLNSYDYVERYFYWNGERDPSKIYKNGKLTPAGEMYAQLDGGVGYNGRYDYIPRPTRQANPSNLVLSYDKETQTARLSWHESNGEMNSSCVVERRDNPAAEWKVIKTVTLKEEAADYTFNDANSILGSEYRIHIVDGRNANRYSNVVMAAANDFMPGDAIQVGGVTKYLGGNVFPNGDFAMGLHGWTNGIGGAIGQPWFQVVPLGGNGNGAYLQAYGGGDANSVSALRTVFDVQPGRDYYFSTALCNTGKALCQALLSIDGEANTSVAGKPLANSSANWLTQFTIFNTEGNSKLTLSLSNLGGSAQVAQLMLCPLYDTLADALEDYERCIKQRAKLFEAYNTLYPQLKGDPMMVDDAIRAYGNMPLLQTLISKAERVLELGLYGADQLSDALVAARNASSPAEVNLTLEILKEALAVYLPQVEMASAVKNPKFNSADGWITKCGTYIGGDQRLNSRNGITFWNAWWSGLSASTGSKQTMAVKQELTGLSHGLYAIECKASTEHYCLSDQHAYIADSVHKEISPALTADYFDLPTVDDADRWQTLATLPIYVDDGGTLTVGFEGSKQGATDFAWHRLGNPTDSGDKREGWWCATDFVLKFTPLYRTKTEALQWKTCCLPYALHASPTVKYYQIAAITDDFQNICLEPIDEVQAGMPFIYRSEEAEASFLEYGEPVARAVISGTPGNLRGFFTTSARVPTNYYHLVDGQWVKVTATKTADRPFIENYSAIMRPVTDNNANPIPVVNQWDGPTMPIVGFTEEEKIQSVSTPLEHGPARVDAYDLQGRHADGRMVKGVRIVNGKKIIK